MRKNEVKEDYYQKLIRMDFEVLHNKGGVFYVIVMKLEY